MGYRDIREKRAGGEARSNLEHYCCGYTNSNLNDEHKEQSDDEAADEGLAALANADNDDDAGQEPYYADENEETLRCC